MNKYKTEIKKIFEKNKKIKCPAFAGEMIIFNSKGMSHIFYKGSHKVFPRPEKEARTRASLIPGAIKLLQNTTFYQEESCFEIDKKLVKYWAFEAVVEDRRIKVIVRQVGNGNKHFWSVIPAWRRIRGKVVNAKGDLSKF